MNFYMPTKVFSEENCVQSHSAELASLGSRALIVTGKSSARRCGAFADVTAALKKHGVTWVEFAEVEENPSVETVMKARDLGCLEKTDFVIGIGGGSPMDAAKAVALMIRHADHDWTYMYDKSAETSTIPIACIPTTAGTGSEVTAVSVLTRHDKHVKGSEAGIRIWARSKDIILGKREASAEDYLNMMNASAMAGMAIAHTATSIPHAMSYRLTYSAGMAHGKACGYFLSAYLREADPKEVSYILGLAGFGSLDDLEDYYVTTCGRDEVPLPILEETVREVLANEGKCKLPPFAVNEEVLKRIAGI